MKFSSIILLIGVLCFSIYADMSFKGSVAVEFTKYQGDSTIGNYDNAWIRGELKAKSTLEKSKLTALMHLRTQPKFTSGTSKIDLQPRQILLHLPISIVELQFGRWYDIYDVGNYYFGRYLHGVSSKGSGVMNTNYSVIDGFKLKINIPPIKCFFQTMALPQDMKYNDVRYILMFGGSPIEGLEFNLAGNLELQTPKGIDPTHRAMLNARYTFLKQLKMGVFGEMAVVNSSEVTDNMWFMVGFTTAAGVVLDRIQAEFEIKNFRDGATDIDNNLAWMLLLRKKVVGLCFDLNIGADPNQLKSQNPLDVGAIFRISASF